MIHHPLDESWRLQNQILDPEDRRKEKVTLYLLRIELNVTDSDVIRRLLNHIIYLIQKLILINVNRMGLVKLKPFLKLKNLLLYDLALFSSRVPPVLHMSVWDQQALIEDESFLEITDRAILSRDCLLNVLLIPIIFNLPLFPWL